MRFRSTGAPCTPVTATANSGHTEDDGAEPAGAILLQLQLRGRLVERIAGVARVPVRVGAVRGRRVDGVADRIVEEQLAGEHRLRVDVHLDVQVGAARRVPAGVDAAEPDDAVGPRYLRAPQELLLRRGPGLRVAVLVAAAGAAARSEEHTSGLQSQ